MLIWHYFTKLKILFWQKQLLYAQSPNANLALIFCKAQILFWHYLQISNIIFDTFFTYTKSPIHGKYNYSSLKEIPLLQNL